MSSVVCVGCWFPLRDSVLFLRNAGAGRRSNGAGKEGLGLHSGRSRRWRSWMMDSSGGSMGRSQ